MADLRLVESDSPTGVLNRDPISVLEHQPFAPSSTGHSITELHAAAAPGEMASLSFSLQAADSAVELTLQASDAMNGSAAVPIELYVVHTWEQAGIGLYQSAAQLVAELLLKDDRQPLRDSYRPGCGHRRHFYRRAPHYQPPDIRLRGEVCTTLQAGQRKQFWVSAKVPGDASPGVYLSTISISALTPESRIVRQLPLRLEILPIRLAEPAQDLFLWYKGTLDCRHPQHYVPEHILRAQLQDIYDHGFTSVSLIEASPEYLQPAIDIANAIGFRRNLLLEGPFHQGYRKLSFGKLQPIYYLSDKLDIPRYVHSTRHHFRNWRLARAAGAASMSSLISQQFARRLLDNRDIGHAPSIFSFYLPTNLDYFRAFAAFPELRNYTTYYYWKCHMEKANLHRVLAGVFLWKSKADGIAPYCYQHRPKFPNSAFNDFDEWEPGYFFGSEQRPFKDHMSTYPAAEGSIPTAQWKGLSAGLFDLRYLATLEAALQTASKSGGGPLLRAADEIRREVDRFLSRINLRTIAILDEHEAEPYADIQPEEYARFRALVAHALVDLQQHMEEVHLSEAVSQA